MEAFRKKKWNKLTSFELSLMMFPFSSLLYSSFTGYGDSFTPQFIVGDNRRIPVSAVKFFRVHFSCFEATFFCLDKLTNSNYTKNMFADIGWKEDEKLPKYLVIAFAYYFCGFKLLVCHNDSLFKINSKNLTFQLNLYLRQSKKLWYFFPDWS